jgi:phage baseplate assembly protein gpV
LFSFESEPAFLEHYAVAGFQVDQRLGEIGTLVLFLQARAHSAKPEFDDHVQLQESLGEEITCEYEGWKFAGTVEGVEFDGATDDFRLVVRDALAPMSRTYASQVFTGRSVEEIAGELLPSGVSLQCVGDIGGRTVPLAIQYQESHLQFLKRLVALNGGQLWCHAGEIYIGSEPGSDPISVRLGTDFLSYSFGTQLGLETVSVNSIAYVDKNRSSPADIELPGGSYGKIQDSLIDARSKSKTDAKLHIVHEDDSYKDVDGLGEAVLRSQASGRFTLTGELKHAVPLGAPLEISNYDKAGGGDKVTENAVVRAVRGSSPPRDEDVHWHVEVANPQALLDPEDLAGNRLFTSTAIVQETDDSMNRAKVSFPWDEGQEVTPWLRLTTPSWGADHVHYIPPLVGDTVLVLWGQWDVDPMIVGAVAAGEEVETPSDRFVFQTAEGHKVTIDGEVVKVVNEASSGGTEVEVAPDSVTVKTKDGHTVEIGSSDIALKHAGGSSVELTNDKIALNHAGGGSVLLESAKIAVNSSGEIELSTSAGASVKLSGPQVSINNGALDVI